MKNTIVFGFFAAFAMISMSARAQVADIPNTNSIVALKAFIGIGDSGTQSFLGTDAYGSCTVTFDVYTGKEHYENGVEISASGRIKSIKLGFDEFDAIKELAFSQTPLVRPGDYRTTFHLRYLRAPSEGIQDDLTLDIAKDGAGRILSVSIKDIAIHGGGDQNVMCGVP